MDFDRVWPNMDRFSPNFVENTLIFDHFSTPTLAISASDATGRALRSYTYIHSAILLRYKARCPKLPARYKARCPSLGTSRIGPDRSGLVRPAPARSQPKPTAPGRTQPHPTAPAGAAEARRLRQGDVHRSVLLCTTAL